MAKNVMQTIEYEPLSDALGVRVLNLDLTKPMSNSEVEVLKLLLAEHCVIYFQNQNLDEDQQASFGQYFGTLKQNLRNYQATRHPAIMYITNEVKDGVLQGALPDGEMFFHSDMCYLESPAKASILFGINIPSTGGDTLFANMFTAYETLPDEIKKEILNKKAINSYDPGKSNNTVSRYNTEYKSETEMSFAQPMVFSHPQTGKKSLYVNRVMTEKVVGMSSEDSQALLEKLFIHQEQEHFVYKHKWKPGDLLMWDNRTTLHARTDFDATELRKLRRVTVSGEPLG